MPNHSAPEPPSSLVDGLPEELPRAVPADPGSSTRSFDLRGRSLREFAARGVMINTGFTVGLSVLGLVRGFVLAGFLSRADYGVWGILVVSLGTLLWLKQVGIGDKYIQQDDADQEVAFQKAFTLEVAFTAMFMAILAVLLPVIVAVYGQPKLLLPGLVILAVLPAGALQAPMWVYTRNMNFFRQRVLQSVEPVVGFVVALAMAAGGAGYWALAGGVLAGAWSGAIVSVLNSRYKLRFRYDRGTLRTYFTFSWPLFVGNGASMVVAQSAVLASEARLGLAGVGAIALASQITAFTDRVDGLITGTLYPAICAVRDRLSLLEESFVKSNRLALMWALPFGVGLSLFAGDLVQFGLGEQWRPVVTVLQIYGITAALGQVGFNWDAYMRATGRTRPIAVASVAAMIVFLAAGLPLLWAYGLTGLAMGVALQALATWIVRAYFLAQLFNGFRYLRHALRAVLPSVPAIAAVLALRLIENGPRTFGYAVGELSLYLLITAIGTWWFERGLLREAVGYISGRSAIGVA